jgi:thiamine transporter ThiT
VISDDHDEGLIGHFSKMCRLDEDKLVKIRASSFFRNGLPKYAAELTTGSVFQSDYAPNQWLTYEFLNVRVEPRSYLIRTDPKTANPKE